MYNVTIKINANPQLELINGIKISGVFIGKII